MIDSYFNYFRFFIKYINNKQFHQNGGYAFIQFESAVDAVEACEKLNGRNWKGSTIGE